MRNEGNQPPPLTIIKGRIVQAIYRNPECPDHQGNPLIEALPTILTDDQAMIRLSYYPQYNEGQRKSADHVRYLLIQNGLKFFAPLDIHIDLQRRFSNLLRVGYVGRNPVRIRFWHDLKAKLDSFDQYKAQYEHQPDRLPSTAAGFNIIGPSGVGKSFSVERVLSLTPQIIHHNYYQDRLFTHSQLVWLKLDCPFDGNLKGLCFQFFKAIDSILGTNYYQDYAKGRPIQDELLSNMVTVAANHFLGVLVIDEIQRLSLAKSGGADRMLNFFVQLINNIGVPVVLIGNYKALSVLSGDFSQMRRGTGQGDLIWDLMHKDEQWELFIESLWRFQYTKKRCSLIDKINKSSKDSPTLSDILYEETQGITDFAVKVYMFAQERAIDSGKEAITASIIRSAAKDKLRIPSSVLHALKTKDTRVLEKYEDLYYKAFKSYLYQQPEAVQVTGKINSAPEIKVVLEALSEAAEQTDLADLTVHTKPNAPKGYLPEVPTKAQKKNKSRSISIKGELPKIVAEIKSENEMAAYEALKQHRHIRSADEFLIDEHN
jgi:hypothetical protein